MSDADVPTDAGASDIILDGVDWFLANQIRLANSTSLEQQITLNVGGVLISGTLIGGRTYFRELAQFTRRSTKGTPSEEIGTSLAENHEQWLEIYPAPTVTEEYRHRPAAYIHLRNAAILGSNGSMVGKHGVLWRGKLTSVDGYFFGSVSIG